MPAAPASSLVTDAGMPSTTQCHQPEPVGASGSNKVTAKFLVCAGKLDHDSEGEMFLPVMPNPSKTWFCDIIWAVGDVIGAQFERRHGLHEAIWQRPRSCSSG